MASEWRSTCGDNYDINNILEDFDSVLVGNGIQIFVVSGVPGMTGNCISILSNQVNSVNVRKNFANQATRYFGMRINTAGVLSNNTGFFGIYDTGTLQIGFSIESDGSIRAILGSYNIGGGTQLLATNPGVVSIGTAFYLGIAVTINTASAGSVSIYVGGILQGTASGITTSASGNNTSNQLELANTSSVSNTMYFDDIKVNNNVGGGNAGTVPLPQQVKVAYPSAAGRYSQMSPVGAAQNYQCVSSVITNGLATYVQAASVLEDAYVMSYPTVSNIDGVSTCDSAWTSDGGSATLTPGFSNGSADALGTAISVPASPHILHQCFDTNPLTGAAFTTGDLATLQRLVQRSA